MRKRWIKKLERMKAGLVGGFVCLHGLKRLLREFLRKEHVCTPYPQEWDTLFLQQMCTELQGHFRKWEPDVQVMWWESIQAKGDGKCKGPGAGDWWVQLRKGTRVAFIWRRCVRLFMKLLSSPKKTKNLYSFLIEGGISWPSCISGIFSSSVAPSHTLNNQTSVCPSLIRPHPC